MLKFNSFLLEVFHDNLESSKPEETERHRKQYYDTSRSTNGDPDEDGIFHRLNGLYVLDRDRTDLRPEYKKGAQLKLSDVQSIPDSSNVMRYHGMVNGTNHSIPMSHFKKPPIGRAGKNQQKLEEEQIKYLTKAIDDAKAKKGSSAIKMRFPNGETHNVAGIKAAGAEGGWPKADAYMHDEAGTPVHWMSLKGDTFQQWGGYRGLDSNPTFQKAIEKFKQAKDKVAPNSKYLLSSSSFHYDLNPENSEDRQLILKSMFGINHGGEHGVNNVHAVYSGNTIGLKENDDGEHELNPNALYVNKNDANDSNLPSTKILVTNRSGLNQLDTGGRIMVTHSGNNNNSKHVDQILKTENRSKEEAGSGEHGAKSFYGPGEK